MRRPAMVCYVERVLVCRGGGGDNGVGTGDEESGQGRCLRGLRPGK